MAEKQTFAVICVLELEQDVGVQPGVDQPPPPPPPGAMPPPRDDNSVSGVPLPVIGIWLAEVALAVYILTKSHHAKFEFPVSPA